MQSDSALIDGRYAWFRLAISLLLGTLGSAGFWAVIVVLPSVQQEFDVSRADASIPYTLAMISFALGNAIIGRYVDRVGIVRPLIITSVSLGIGFIGGSLADSLWLFALIHGLLIGMGTACTFGPLIADLSHWFRVRRGIAVSLTACGNYLGGALWPLVIQVIMDHSDWRTAYVLVGVCCLVVMTPLAFLLRRPPPIGESGPNSVLDAGPRPIALSQRNLLILLSIAGVCCCVAMSMPQVHLIAYCGDLGYDVAYGAEMLSLMLAGGAVSRILTGLLADRIGGARTLLLSSIMQAIGLSLFLYFNGLTSLYIVSLIFGLSQGGIVPSYAIIAREYMPARIAGRRVGFLIMATVAGMALGGWVSGWIYDVTASYQAAFLNGIAWNLLNIGIVLVILLRTLRFTPSRLMPA